MSRAESIVLKLPQLQNLIKRDPLAYKDEFMMQKNHFDSELAIFKLRPTKDSERFTELVTFVSHVASCYMDECMDIPRSLLQLMESQASTLHPDVRAKLFQALILLRNKGMLDPLCLLRLSFKLFSVQDKTLRLVLGEYILNDIKGINVNKHNEKLNRSVQAILFSVVSEDTSVAAYKTVEILGELYRRRVWTDARTVNVLGTACLSSSTKVFVGAMNFFLGIETKMLEDEEEEQDTSKVTKEVDYHSHSKKTRKRQRHVEKQVDRNKKLRREQEGKKAEAIPLFPAIQLLHDPQSLSEKLFRKLRQSNERFEVRLLMMNFISRLIGCHKLLLLSFYSFIQRYLTSHQQDVTQILAYLVQSCHELVPPEELLPVVKSIAYNFITERCSNEVITVGINCVREIIVRVPALLREPGMDDFMQDLAMYGRKCHKSVMVAAHGIVNLVREMYPALLRKVDRGKNHDITSVPSRYGEIEVAEGVAGVELLEAYERGDIIINSDDEVIWKDGMEDDEEEVEEEEEGEEEEEEEEEEEGAKQLANDGDDDSEGWVDVDSDESESNNEEGEIENSVDEASEGDKGVKKRLDVTRVLSDEDFKLLERLRAAQAERAKDPRFRTKGALAKISLKRLREDDEDEDAGPQFAVTPEQLAPSMKTGKTSKIERMTKVLEGRKESKFEHGGHKGGLTNLEKLRKKNYIMVRKGKKSVASKVNKSNSDLRYEKMHRKVIFGRDKRKRRRT